MSPQESDSTVYKNKEDILANDAPDVERLGEITLDPVSKPSQDSDIFQTGTFPFSLLSNHSLFLVEDNEETRLLQSVLHVNLVEE